MSAAFRSLPQAVVLHGVQVAAEPRLLRRAGAPVLPPAGPSGPAAQPAEAAEALPVAAARALDPQADGYRDGLARGRQEGLEEGLERGFEEGLERGLAQGREQGHEAGWAEVLSQARGDREAVALRIQLLDQLLANLPPQFNERLGARLALAEEDMVALCMTVLCRFLGEGLVRREAVVSGVRQAIEQCCGSGPNAALAGLLSIHVHPRALEFLQQDPELAAWLERCGLDPMPWVADPRVRLGGCIVRASQGSLDARLETQLAALRETLAQPAPDLEGGRS
jgi:flagellar assembly protein FliH